MPSRSNSSSKLLGFGFDPAESEHHFLVAIPAGKKDKVCISEHFRWQENEAENVSMNVGSEDAKLKVYLDRFRWDSLADAVQNEFNIRLKKQKLKTGKWKNGAVPVARMFGKELTLLAWAIEDADPVLIPTAIRNWQGLTPEERWWLFTMTNAASGHAITGRGIGWRKAVRFALTENPVSDAPPVRRKEGLFAGLDD